MHTRRHRPRPRRHTRRSHRNFISKPKRRSRKPRSRVHWKRGGGGDEMSAEINQYYTTQFVPPS